jgi:hypothetical protein
LLDMLSLTFGSVHWGYWRSLLRVQHVLFSLSLRPGATSQNWMWDACTGICAGRLSFATTRQNLHPSLAWTASLCCGTTLLACAGKDCQAYLIHKHSSS